MKKTLEEKLTAIFESGESIRIQNVVKRNEGEWHNRITWEHVQLPAGQFIEQCDWFGFETIEECADDCLNYIDQL